MNLLFNILPLILVFLSQSAQAHEKQTGQIKIIKKLIEEISNETYDSKKIIAEFLPRISGDNIKERTLYQYQVIFEMRRTYKNISNDRIKILNLNEMPQEIKETYVLPKEVKMSDVYIIKVDENSIQSISFIEDQIFTLVTLKMGYQNRIVPF